MFSKKTDKNMIETVISSSSGVSLSKTAASLSSVTHDQFVRKQQSAWDFVQDRAGAYGLVIRFDNGAMSMVELDETSGSQSVELGIDEVLDIALAQNAENLNKTVNLNYWDVKKDATGAVKKTDSATIAKDASVPDATYTLMNLTDKKSAEGVKQYFSTLETMESICGTITIPGDSSAQLMQKLTLKSFPAAYNGDHTVSRVTQEVRFGTWTTKIGVGFSSVADFLPNPVENPTSPKVTDTEFALALKWAKDPEGLGRIPVKILAFGTDTYWAYPSQVAAGKKQSSYVLPEENEQLIVGFLNGSYNEGFVITSTYLGSNKPPSPFKLDAKTPVGFLSTAGMKLVFDDDKTSIEMSTSSSNKQFMDKSGGVEVKTNKDFKTNSSGKTEIKASSKMTLKGATIDLN
jgi:phage baseplate assembly protein gpV